jgi:hypothetical protein
MVKTDGKPTVAWSPGDFGKQDLNAHNAAADFRAAFGLDRRAADANYPHQVGCGCECCFGGFCGGCGHAGCGGRKR